MSENPSRTTAQTSGPLLSKPILIAGLLGGLLGGLTSYAGSRFFKPAVAAPALTLKEKAIEEARPIVEAFLEELKPGTPAKNDEFWNHVKMGYTFMSDEDFKDTKKKFDNSRIILGVFGQSLHQFELIKENAASPNLVEFVYMERFERGPVIWRFIMYRAKDNWRVALLDWTVQSHDAFTP
jgi:hypothetical protein